MEQAIFQTFSIQYLLILISDTFLILEFLRIFEF